MGIFKLRKGGDLQNNVITLIIAALGIALLVFAIVRIYQATVNQESENAKKIIDIIEAKINALDEGEYNTFPIRGVKGWKILGWERSIPIDNKPEKCSLKSCICICPDATIESCQKEGFCRFFDKDVRIVTLTRYDRDLNNEIDLWDKIYSSDAATNLKNKIAKNWDEVEPMTSSDAPAPSYFSIERFILLESNLNEIYIRKHPSIIKIVKINPKIMERLTPDTIPMV